MENEKKMTLEEGFEKLDEITRKMEQNDVPLEDRFELYKKGIDLVKFCTEKIDTVEKEMQIVRDHEPAGGMDDSYGI